MDIPLKNNLLRRLGAGRLNQWAALLLRLYIGGVFIYAGIPKITYTAEFAEIIAGYSLLPYWLVNIVAVSMPWLELLCGFMLVLGVRSKAAALILIGLLAVFTTALVVNLLRGLPLGCGCFSTVGEPMTWWTVLRDISWLLMTVHVYLFDRLLHLEDKLFGALLDLFKDSEVEA